MIRLNKYLSGSGRFSRRSADEAIEKGEITVNNEIAALGQNIDPAIDVVKHKNEIIKSEERLVYYALNKPLGVISTVKDEKGRKNVTDLVPPKPHVYPVGRLDANTSGLIILTNDGELTKKLTHPSFLHQKEYLLLVRKTRSNKNLTPETVKAMFERGVVVDGKTMKADTVTIVRNGGPDTMEFNLTIHTGYNRQIRKMSAKIGLEVCRLSRLRVGKLSLDVLGIKAGEYREIKKEEII